MHLYIKKNNLFRHFKKPCLGNPVTQSNCSAPEIANIISFATQRSKSQSFRCYADELNTSILVAKDLSLGSLLYNAAVCMCFI